MLFLPSPTPTPALTPSHAPTLISPSILPSHVQVPAVPIVNGSALLTTLVASGAALVAIIAGLLIARLVSVAGERASLERQVSAAEKTRDHQQTAFDQARADIDAYSALIYLTDHVKGIVASYPMSLDDVVNSWPLDNGLALDQLRPHYEHFLRDVARLSDEVDYDTLAQGRPTDWESRCERLRDSHIGMEYLIVDALIDRLEAHWEATEVHEQFQEHPSAWLYASLYEQSQVSPIISEADLNLQNRRADRWHELLRDRDTAEDRLKAAGLEVEIARRAHAAVAQPTHLKSAFVYLLIVTVACLVIPLAGMTLATSEPSSVTRAIYVLVFLLGLVAFIVHIGLEMIHVSKAPADVPEPQAPSASMPEPRRAEAAPSAAISSTAPPTNSGARNP